jgi:hypothetical protein
MRRYLRIAGQMGAAAIVLDVLGDADFERRWRFYKGLGFRPLGVPENPRRAFIPMADVRMTLSDPAVSDQLMDQAAHLL